MRAPKVPHRHLDGSGLSALPGLIDAHSLCRVFICQRVRRNSGSVG